jgi:hypothetical protein
MKLYILIIFGLIILGIGLRFSFFIIKEGAANASKKQIRKGNPEEDSENKDYYYTPRDEEINETLKIVDNLKSIMPITFGTGKISYEMETPTEKLPSVTFSGKLPYIFINIKLPYPNAGDLGKRGEKGQSGPDGEKGETGDKGRKGYVGSNFLPWAFRS